MSSFINEAPLKVNIKDLGNFVKSNKSWIVKFDETETTVEINKVHIQGEIQKTAGLLKEIIILSDDTGKAKITRGPNVPGDFSWVDVGTYCSVIGNLLDNGKLPHIKAIKIAKIDSDILQKMWQFEIIELRNVLANKVQPNIFESDVEESEAFEV